MNTESIGYNAGSVWTALDGSEALTVKQLKRVTKLKDRELYAAIGWLAREDKIAIAADPEDEKSILVSLLNK